MSGVFKLGIVENLREKMSAVNVWTNELILMKYSIQDYLYRAFHETIIVKQLYRKLSFYNRFIYYRNLIYLTYGKIWLILYILWGVGIISSQMFGHLGSFKDWIQIEVCVILSYHRMLILWQKQRNK